MLPSTSDFALRAVLLLARAPAAGAVRPDELARQTSADEHDLIAILSVLAEAGIVARRGAFEGYSLAIPADRLSLARIVDCFEDGPPDVCAPGTVKCDPMRPCAAHEGWPKLVAARRDMLRSTTVAELLAGGRTVSDASPEHRPAAAKTGHGSTIAWRAAAPIRRRQLASASSSAETHAMSLRLHDPSRHSVPRFVSTLVMALAALLAALSLTG